MENFFDPDQFIRDNPGAYEAEHNGHKLIVWPVPGGKGYNPYELVAQGKVSEAATVANSAWRSNV